MSGSKPASKLDIMMHGFEKDLEDLINRHCIDDAMNIPDHLLAQHIVNSMYTLRHLLMQRKKLHMFIDQFDDDLAKDPYQIEREKQREEK